MFIMKCRPNLPTRRFSIISDVIYPKVNICKQGMLKLAAIVITEMLNTVDSSSSSTGTSVKIVSVHHRHGDYVLVCYRLCFPYSK